MGSRNHERRRQAAIDAVRAGTIAAANAYGTMDGSGSLTRGMLEPYEAEAKAAGTGIWGNATGAERADATASMGNLQAKATANAPRVTGYGAVKMQSTIERTPNRASGTGAPALPLAARAPSASQPTIARGGFNLQAVGSAGGRMGAMPAAPAAAAPTIARTPTYGAFGGQTAAQYSAAAAPSASGTGAPAATASGPMDAIRKKALEDELADLWSNMGWSQGTAAYPAYKRRADAIEQELNDEQKATIQRTPTPGAFGSGVTTAGRPANYNTAPGQQMQTPAKVGERRANPYGGEDVVWSGTSWDSATEWATKQAKAAQPSMPTVERPRSAAATTTPAAPPTRSDYVPPTTSRFESTPGFDQAQYAEVYNQAHVNDIKKQYQRNLTALRENFAARGLGNSQAAQQAYIQAEMDMRGQIGEIGADARQKSIELGRTDAIQRAGQIDNYGLARGGFGINYARDNRDATREDSMLPLDTQIKVLEAAGINLRNTGLQLANDGSVIQNDHNRAIVDFYKQTRPIEYQKAQQDLDSGAVDLEIKRATSDARIEQIKAAAQSAVLANERTRFDIDYAQSVAPTLRATAEAQLREIEQRVTAAAQKQDWAMVDELGKIAGRVAKAGGFKVAGGILGTVIGSIIPGAGNVAGGAVGTAIGAGLDGILGG